MSFFSNTPCITFTQSMRVYWPFLIPLFLQPLVAFGIRATRPEFSIVNGIYFVVAGVLAMWPSAFKNASTSFWLTACLIWFIISTAASFL